MTMFLLWHPKVGQAPPPPGPPPTFKVRYELRRRDLKNRRDVLPVVGKLMRGK